MPEMPGGRSNEPLDLGTITAKLFDAIKIGDLAPDFDVERIGTQEKGQRLKLSDYRGKLVLLNFWEPWDRQNDMTVLKEVQETFGSDPRFVLISLACGKDAAQAETVHQGEWTGLDARLCRRFRLRRRRPLQDPGDPERLCLSVPIRSDGGSRVTFLIGPDGRIVGHDLSGADLEAVRKARLATADQRSPREP